MPSFGMSFDPTQQDNGSQFDPNAPKRAPQSVQNAIQYLSLRMPKVVGARSPVMPGLLGGIGAAGPSPHVDAIVNQVLGRVLGPQASAPTAPTVPNVPPMAAPPSGGFSAPPSAAPTSPQSQPAAPPSPTPPPRISFPSMAAPEGDMRAHQVPPPDMRPHEIPSVASLPTAPSPGPYGPDMRAHEIPSMAALPSQGPDRNALLDEARKRVGTGGDWNQYQSMDDPFVKLFAQTFGRGDWNALK